MKSLLTNAFALLAVVGIVTAAPAIVWTKRTLSASPIHSSDVIDVQSLIASTYDTEVSSASLSAVIFVVGRDKDGSEALTRMTSTGALPAVEQSFPKASSVYYHLQGVKGSQEVAKDVRKVLSDKRVMEVSIKEFNDRIAAVGKPSEASAGVHPDGSIDDDEAIRRARLLSAANILVVNVLESQANALDNAVSKALEHDEINTVILTAVRSLDEAKLIQNLLLKEKSDRRSGMMNAHRRLANENNNNNKNNNNNANNNQQEFVSGVYFVNMTPNIFSGIMFFLFFIFVAHVGIGCMNQITSTDVYCDKYPAIGREA